MPSQARARTAAIATRSSEETIRVARLRHEARLAAPEPVKPIARDDAVESVAQRARHDAERFYRAPREAEPLEHSDRAFRLEECAAALEQHVRLVVDGIEAVVLVQRRAERRLCGQQAEALVAVVAHHEARPARAQHALAVEDKDRLVVGKRRHCRIRAIAIRLAQGAHQFIHGNQLRNAWRTTNRSASQCHAVWPTMTAITMPPTRAST